MIRIALNRERKYILAIGMVALLVGLGYRFFPSGGGGFDQDAQIALKSRKIVEYRKKAAELSSVEAALQDSRKRLERAEGLLLNGGTEALAAVDIQNILNEIAFRSKVDVKTMRVLTPQKLKNKQYIGIRVEVSLNASIRQLEAMIYRIGCSNRQLTIQRLSVSVPGASSPLHLHVTLVVAGAMKANAA